MFVAYVIRVERKVVKGEITHYEQFLFLPQCFQKSSAAHPSICMQVGKGKRLTRSNDRLINTM